MLKKQELYTFTEARQKLGGMTGTSFMRLVKAGKIGRVVPPNKKQGLYVKDDVDKMAEAMQAFVDVYSTVSKVEFVQAKENELKAMVQIAKSNLGELYHPLENRRAWYQITGGLSDYVLKDGGVIVGYISIGKLAEGAIEDHIFVPNGALRAEDIVPFTKGDNECYLISIGTRIEANRQHERIYGALLISGLIRTVTSMALEQGIWITKIWAKSRTVSGIRLCRDMQFRELDYIDNEQVGFVLDMHEATHHALQGYRQLLLEHEAQH
jgi:hypothetical protein